MKVLDFEKGLELIKNTKGEEITETLPETGCYDEDADGNYVKKLLPKDIFSNYDVIESGFKPQLESLDNSIANPKEIVEDFIEISEITGLNTFSNALVKKDIIEDVVVPKIEELELTDEEKEVIKGKESWYTGWSKPYKIVIKTTKGDYEVETEVMGYRKDAIKRLLKK